MRQTILIDDLNASTDDVATLTFTWEGRAYSIDLCRENRERFTAQMNEWVSAATPVKEPRKPRTQTKNSEEKRAALAEQRAAREWAQANGIEVSDRGRLSSDILEKYRQRSEETPSHTTY